MAKYDADGSGELDEDEMEEIKAWVEQEQLKQEVPSARMSLFVCILKAQ
jgi:hypothetical protein